MKLKIILPIKINKSNNKMKKFKILSFKYQNKMNNYKYRLKN